MALRVVITTRDDERHRLLLAYFEERVGRAPDGVLIQARTPDRKMGTHRGWRDPRAQLAGRLAGQSFNVRRRLARHRLAPRPPLDGRILDAFAPLRPVAIEQLAHRTAVRVDVDPNSPETAAWLEELEPDLVIVFGGRILREPWLSLPKLGAVNMHYGVLPWYGGAASAEYALYHDRVDRVGITIHQIASGVDDGPILERRLVDTSGCRELAECQVAVYRAGIESLVDQVLRFDSGDRPVGTPQMGTRVYRRKQDALVVETVAQIRLRNGGDSFPVQQALDRMNRGRGLRGRLLPGSIPSGVYVLLYHSIVDPASADPWELSFGQVATPMDRFRDHLRYLASHMTPATLSDAFELLREGPADRAYAVLTFDDGYTNLSKNAAPICAAYGFRPTVFVSAAFAAQDAVHYRLLLAELIRSGHAARVAEVYSEALPDYEFNAVNLWAQSKDTYRVGVTEEATERAWSLLMDVAWPHAHLSYQELGQLAAQGWSIGNHTLRHVPLVDLATDELERQIVENERQLREAGLAPIPWISYPFGRRTHVDATLDAFLDRNPERYGIFASGGINVIPSRKEWLRMSVEGDVSLAGVRRRLFLESRATLAALDSLAS